MNKRRHVISAVLSLVLTFSIVSGQGILAAASGTETGISESGQEPGTAESEQKPDTAESEQKPDTTESEQKPDTTESEQKPDTTESEQEPEKPQEPISITTADELKAIAQNPGASYVLKNDIDLSGQAAWVSITGFSGSLDGNGHAVKGLTASLIDSMTGGSISRLSLTGVKISGTGSTGALVNTLGSSADKKSVISGITVSGTVSGTDVTGGIIGTAVNTDAEMTIEACSFSGSVTGQNEVGGIIGLVKCSSVNGAAAVSMTGLANAGTIKGTSKIGGILGAAAIEDSASNVNACVTLEKSYNVGLIDSISSYSGGMAGYIEIPGTASASQAVKIENCYNTGKMRDGGNISGEIRIASGSILISKCIGNQTYNSATKGIVDNVQPVYGDTTGTCTLADCYYFTANGEYAYTSSTYITGTATALNETQMKTAASFKNFDFANVWVINAAQNGGYPYLKDLALLPVTYAPPAKGVVLNDTATEGSYKVTAPGRTVTYMGTTNPAASTVTIPSKVEIDGWSYEVTAIASRAFYQNTTLTKITIPNTVTVINCGAFFGCTSLKTVSGCRGVKKIYKNVFRDCKKLTTIGYMSNRITMPSIVFIGKRGFLNCSSIKNVLLSSEDLTTIGTGAFRKCTAMTKINIASPVLSHIGKYSFYQDAKLKTIILYTNELTSSNVGKKAYTGTKSTAVFQVPSAKVSTYKSLFQSKGAGSSISVKAL